MTVPDRGSSLLETLLSAALIGLISTSLGMASTSVSISAQTVMRDLEHTRDVQRLHDVIPVDLRRYPLIDTTPNALGHLPGTNVFTLFHDEVDSTSPEFDASLVSYRYISRDGSWDLVRIHLDDSSTPATSSTQRTMATRLAAPPPEWSPADHPTHAVSYIAESVEPIEPSSTGETRSVDISFAAGDRFRVGALFRSLADAPQARLPDDVPIVPVARCGGTITLVFNTASTIWSQGAAPTVIGDLTAFIQSLRGTPTHLRIVTFDRLAQSFYPDVAVGTYVDMLNPSSSITTMLSKLSNLSTSSSSWRNGRNWEDGLWQAARSNTGSLLAQGPDLVVFLTDGSPNRNRTNTTTDTDTTFHAADLTRAVTAAHHARNTGAMLIGIALGTGVNTTAVSHLTSVFGSLTWDGDTAVAPLDRARTFTRPTSEGFVRLDEILNLVGKWRCGGTVTVQQRVLNSGVAAAPSDSWPISVSVGASSPAHVTVDASRPSATVDAGPSPAGAIRTITFTQQPLPGYRHHSATCTAENAPLTLDTAAGSGGVTTISLTATSDAVVSCVLTAEPIP